MHHSGQFVKCLEKKEELALPGKQYFTSFPFAFCVFKNRNFDKIISTSKIGPFKKKQYWDLCGQKLFASKRLFHFFYFETPLRISKTKWRNSLFLQNSNFKPHDENCLSLWCGLCRKRCIGEWRHRTWASTTFREVVWCIIPKKTGNQSS